MSAGKAKYKINGFALLGSKQEKERGAIDEENLSKSIQNLKLRSTYSSGFGVSAPSFMISQKRVPLIKQKKSLSPAKSDKLKDETNYTKVDNSLVVFEDAEFNCQATNENLNQKNCNIESNKEIKYAESEVLKSSDSIYSFNKKSESKKTKMEKIIQNEAFNIAQQSKTLKQQTCITRNNIAGKGNLIDKKPNDLICSYESVSHSSLKPDKIAKNMSEGAKYKEKVVIKSSNKSLLKSMDKPPLVPKKKLFTDIQLNDGVRYICRLNNHLTPNEISSQLAFQNSQRISCNTFVIYKQLKPPHISARDVYEKVVYDAVRKESKEVKVINKDKSNKDFARRHSVLSKSEMQLLNVLIPKEKRKDHIKKTLHDIEDMDDDINK